MLKKLSLQEHKILIEKATEMPFSGEYCDHFAKGIFQYVLLLQMHAVFFVPEECQYIE